MSAGLAISLDAMGGDNAPEMVVRGADIARRRFPQAKFLFFGDEAKVRPLLESLPDLKKVSTLRHTVSVVTMEDKPSQALRSGRGSSMRLAIDAVHNGEANAVVSAGNTGALMAMAKFVLKTMPGIDRPAIASFFPTLRSESVMLDLGANVQCDADNLVQFAVMGNVFARTVLGVREPSMGLLNVGSEELKGKDAVKVASGILRQASLPGKFYGFVEGDDITRGTVDVIVTDGFTGNVALKTSEGLVEMIEGLLGEELSSTLTMRMGSLLARRALRRFRRRVDYSEYGGAPLLGVNKLVIVGHGRSSPKAVRNAVAMAYRFASNRFIERVEQDIAAAAVSPQ